MSGAERVSVGVVVERRLVDQPWRPVRWSVVGLLPGTPAAVEPWTPLARGEGWERYYAGALEIELFRGETSGYRDNLDSSRPAVYVVLRREGGGVALHAATVDPGEAEAHSDAGDDIIEAVPLPAEIAAWMRDFVARHHVEQPFYKRKRDRADPEALAPRRPRVSGPEDHDGDD